MALTDTWEIQTSSADSQWKSICWAPGLSLFVSVSWIAGSTAVQVMTSPDGATWTSRTSAANLDWNSVCWSQDQSLLVAVASTGTGNRVMTSSNGTTWTSRTSAADNSWRSVCYSPSLNLFVAVGSSGTGNRVMTSPDGVTWTIRTSAADNAWYSVCWAESIGLFVAVARTGTGNRVMTSPDGTTWTVRTSAADNPWNSVCWSEELSLLVAVADTGTNRVMTSPDGVTWTSRSASSAQIWNGVCWSPELQIFAAVSSSSSSTKQCMTSPDGITWTDRDTETGGDAWFPVCWSPKLCQFATVGVGSGNNGVMTWDFSADLPLHYLIMSYDPIGYWPFDEPSGSTNAYDSSGNNITLNTVGTVTFGETELVNEGGSCALLNGTTGHIRSYPDTNSDTIKSIYTVTNGFADASDDSLLSRLDSSTNEFALFLDNNGSQYRPAFGYYDGGFTYVYGSYISDDANAHDYAVTWDSSTNVITIYRDGVSVGSGSSSSNPFQASGGYIYIGRHSYVGGGLTYLDGHIDDSAFFGTTLSADDVYNLHNTAFNLASTLEWSATKTSSFSGTILNGALVECDAAKTSSVSAFIANQPPLECAAVKTSTASGSLTYTNQPIYAEAVKTSSMSGEFLGISPISFAAVKTSSAQGTFNESARCIKTSAFDGTLYNGRVITAAAVKLSGVSGIINNGRLLKASAVKKSSASGAFEKAGTLKASAVKKSSANITLYSGNTIASAAVKKSSAFGSFYGGRVLSASAVKVSAASGLFYQSAEIKASAVKLSSVSGVIQNTETAVDTTAYAINTTNSLPSSYTNFNFLYLGHVGNDIYGFKADGVYKLTGTDDNGTEIDTEILTGQWDGDEDLLKLVEMVHADIEGDANILVQYDDDTPLELDFSTGRAKPGGGNSSGRLAFGVRSIAGSHLKIRSLEPVVHTLRKRDR